MVRRTGEGTCGKDRGGNMWKGQRREHVVRTGEGTCSKDRGGNML